MRALPAGLFFFCLVQLNADVIILNDRTTYYGQVTPADDGGYTIIHNDGKKTTVAAKDIQRIIDDNARSVWFNRSKLPSQWKKETGGYSARTWLALELSENGLPGLGFSFEHYLGAGFAPVLAAGTAPWGARYGAGLRFFPMGYGRTKFEAIPAIAVGYSFTNGSLTSVKATGSKKRTYVAVEDVDMIHLSGMLFAEQLDRAARIFVQGGYAFPLGGPPGYRVTSGKLNDKNLRLLERWRPSGLMLSLGGALAF